MSDLDGAGQLIQYLEMIILQKYQAFRLVTKSRPRHLVETGNLQEATFLVRLADPCIPGPAK